jgi:hypothetical protein
MHQGVRCAGSWAARVALLGTVQEGGQLVC